MRALRNNVFKLNMSCSTVPNNHANSELSCVGDDWELCDVAAPGSGRSPLFQTENPEEWEDPDSKGDAS